MPDLTQLASLYQQQVPTTGGDGGERLQDETLRGMEAQMRPRTGLAPLKPNPKAGNVGMGKRLMAGAVGMFVPFLGQAIMSQAKAQKEAQITEAANEFSSLNDALEMASTMAQMEQLQGKIGPDKVQERTQELWHQQPAFKALFDPMNPASKKRLKNFAKVFQQDWMNPEKAESTPHAQGLKRFMQLNPSAKLIKHMATSLQNKQGRQQPQPGQNQPQQNQADPSAGMQQKMNLPDPKALTPYSEYLRAIDSVRNRYDFKFDNEGKPFAFDKRTGDAKEVKVLQADGTEKAPTMAIRGKGGQVASVDGVPIGVYGINANGQPGIKHPGDANWTGEDAKTFEAAKAAWAQGEASKDRRIQVSETARARAWATTRQYSVYDTETGNMIMADALQISQARGRYAGAPQAMQLTNRSNLFNEIEGTENELKRVVDKMGNQTFDEVTKAQLAVALKTDNPMSALQSFLKSNAASTLSEPQVEYVTAIAALEESALSLRTLGGMGQGSDMMRAAILRMVPGAGTPSAAYAKRQLELFDIEVKGLKKSQPGLGNTGGKKDNQPKSSPTSIEEFRKKLREAVSGPN